MCERPSPLDSREFELLYTYLCFEEILNLNAPSSSLEMCFKAFHHSIVSNMNVISLVFIETTGSVLLNMSIHATLQKLAQHRRCSCCSFLFGLLSYDLPFLNKN